MLHVLKAIHQHFHTYSWKRLHILCIVTALIEDVHCLVGSSSLPVSMPSHNTGMMSLVTWVYHVVCCAVGGKSIAENKCAQILGLIPPLGPIFRYRHYTRSCTIYFVMADCRGTGPSTQNWLILSSTQHLAEGVAVGGGSLDSARAH